MSMETELVSIAAAVLQFVVGLALAMASVYIGLKMFDRLTKGVDEWQAIKNGNVAVGIVMAAVIISIATVVQSGVLQVTAHLGTDESIGDMLVGLGIGLINLLIGLVAAIIAIYIAVKTLDRITKDIDEMSEIAKGNVAVAVIMAGVLISVSFVISAAVSGVSNALGSL